MKSDQILKYCKLFFSIVKNAMLINDISDSENIVYVIASGADIWLLPHWATKANNITKDDLLLNKELSKSYDDMIKKFNIDRTKGFYPKKCIEIINNKPKALTGIFNRSTGELELNSIKVEEMSLPLSPESSILVKKVVDTLKVKKIITKDRNIKHKNTYTFESKDIIGKLPTSMFHGTNLHSAKFIATHGLMPKPEESSYKNVFVSNQYIFLTTSLSEARSHAERSLLHSDKKTSAPKNNRGVVFLFKIPDKNRLVPDRDIDIMSSETLFQEPEVEKSLGKDKDSFKLSKEYGIFGYQGRIPPSFIEKIYLIDSNNNANEISKQELIELANQIK